MGLNLILDLSPDEIYRKMIIEGFKSKAMPFLSELNFSIENLYLNRRTNCDCETSKASWK